MINAWLMHGDCLERMKEIPDGSVDMVLTDPPYGTTKCAWDSAIPFEPMWEQLKRVTKHNGAIVMTAIQPFTSALIMSNPKMFKYCWIWEKERLVKVSQVKRRAGKTVEDVCVFYSSQCTYNPQMIKYDGPKRGNKVKNGKIGLLVNSGGENKVKEYVDNGTRYPTQVLRFSRDILTCNLHHTQKPVALMEYLIKTYTNEGENVLDFTMGSGTTGVAAKNLNRSFIGIELDETYFRIAKERIENTNRLNEFMGDEIE